MKQLLHNPIDYIVWLNPQELQANDYNPNVVQKAELTLLKHNIQKYGWIQPVLIASNKIIIDGFHRVTLARLEGWEVPCTVMDLNEAERKLLTICINRAKGEHVAFKMADIVKDLLHNHGLTKEYIAQSIGATTGEVELLLCEDVFKKLNIDKHQYSQAWIPK